MSAQNYIFTITASDVNAASNLSTQEKTYLSQLLNSGVDLAEFFVCEQGVTLNMAGRQDATSPIPRCGIGKTSANYTSTAPAIAGYGAKYLGGIPLWFTNNKIDLVTQLTQKLQSIGVNVATNGNVTVVAPDTPFSTLVSAAKTSIASGTGIPAAFTDLSNSFSFGYSNTQIDGFFADPANSSAVQQAVQLMNYPIPVTDDSDGQNQLEQIYWAAFYLVQYPLKSSYSSSDCEMIEQAIKDLTAEITNITTAVATNYFYTYTRNDYGFRNTAVSDMISKYNILDAKYNCTASIAKQINQQANAALQSGTSGGTTKPDNTIWYVILGASVLILSVVVIKKMKKKGGAPSTASAPIAENKAAA